MKLMLRSTIQSNWHLSLKFIINFPSTDDYNSPYFHQKLMESQLLGNIVTEYTVDLWISSIDE